MNLFREQHKAFMAEPSYIRERRGWWKRNGDFVGLILWSVAGLLVFSEVIMVAENWPR